MQSAIIGTVFIEAAGNFFINSHVSMRGKCIGAFVYICIMEQSLTSLFTVPDALNPNRLKGRPFNS
jgi:hypothetical protein